MALARERWESAGHLLLGLPGAGPITVGRVIAEVGDVRRFRTADAFAALAGVAPILSELGPGSADAPQPGRQPPAQSGAPCNRGVASQLSSPGQVRPVYRLLLEGAAAQLAAA
jgi:Transposase IS116/IS110/IS902 family